MKIDISLPECNGIPATKVSSRNFSQEDITTFLLFNAETFQNQKEKAGFKKDENICSKSLNINNIKLNFYEKDTSKTNMGRIITATQSAIVRMKILLSDTPFPQETLHIYCAEKADLSLGYLFIDKDKQHAAILLGKTALSPAQSTMSETVATRHFSGNLSKYTETIVIHELGHVLHQISKIEHYITLARITEIGGQGISKGAVQESINRSPDVKSKLTDVALDSNVEAAEILFRFISINKFAAKGISLFAYLCAMNEFVAERFAAGWMGITIGTEGKNVGDLLNKPFPNKDFIETVYTQLGGPRCSPVMKKMDLVVKPASPDTYVEPSSGAVPLSFPRTAAIEASLKHTT